MIVIFCKVVLYRHMDDWLFVRQHNMGIWMIVVFYVVALDDCGFELRHPRCVCNMEVQVRK